jgi:membrane peptidoglycan carboxypeptidase
LVFGCVTLAAGCIAFVFVSEEARTSRLQAETLAPLARSLTFERAPGPGEDMRFPDGGPYDLRLGYVHLPRWIAFLSENGYRVDAQARLSPALREVIDRGAFAIYREKTQAGLQILDRHGRSLFKVSFPERVYPSFDSIPPLVVDTLLFIENRELLDPDFPYRNPAVEWDRLAKAVLDMAAGLAGAGRKTPGASTLATQLEKFRHSPDGVTGSPLEKLRQMVSASLRAYLEGEDTREVRRRIVVDYINSIPLAAVPGYGEVIGLGDGLWAWYGSDFEETNRILWRGAMGATGGTLRDLAISYRQVLSLLLAQRRPSFYLVSGREALQSLTESYLRLLSRAGIITPELADSALAVRPPLLQGPPSLPLASFLQRKAANAVRNSLLSRLGLERLYDLDRLDLAVGSTIDGAVQEEVTKALSALKETARLDEAGLRAARLLQKGDPSGVMYSLTLYERARGANLLRVQTDNLDQPFNINEGVKLDLGSTAKLRTLVTYLEIVAELYERYGGLSARELQTVQVHPSDQLSRWAIDHLSGAEKRDLGTMLERALQRHYSASPEEAFFTGGGLHTFANFSEEDNHKVLSVREAFVNSVNLVFVRLMRDIVQHFMYRVPGSGAWILEDLRAPERRSYLSRFADQEGREFIARFYRKYKGKGSESILETLLHGIQPVPKRLAVGFRSVKLDASFDEFAAFMASRLHGSSISEKTLRELYETYAPHRFSLADRGYLARIHPLELWTAAFLCRRPEATQSELIRASAEERQEVYRWLLKGRLRRAQERRIRTMLEAEAFQEIHRRWRRLGYPFESLVPSYATAIGSSADQPAALAELVGIIMNEGVRYPMERVEWLHFGEGTPYETLLRRRDDRGERVLPREVARAVKGCLVDVVEQGTARRARRAFVRSDGIAIPLGGKTGTGDHRYEVYGSSGQLVSSRVMNRAATFVFFVGDRFFGAITAYVPGGEAASYDFTSALPVQLLKHLAPILMPLLEEPRRELDVKYPGTPHGRPRPS